MENKIIGVTIYLEKRKTRLHVGLLNRIQGKFVFTYDENYFRAKNVLPLGPEFPLTQRKFESEKLFSSFVDRIPSRQNPAYIDYCNFFGIDPAEQDPMILLSSIGKKGPSSFIFYPFFDREITAENVIKFRQLLGLTTREFAKIFECSQSSLTALEKNRSAGKELLKRFEVIIRVRSVTVYFLLVNGGVLSHDKWVHAMNQLKKITD